MSGRINAVIGRGITVKSYLEGSYFGDFEMFSDIRRIFSARAEEKTTLICFESGHIREKLKTHSQSLLNFYANTFARYWKFKVSLGKIKCFSKLNMNEVFWDDQIGNKDPIINRDIRKWFERVVQYHREGVSRYNLIDIVEGQKFMNQFV